MYEHRAATSSLGGDPQEVTAGMLPTGKVQLVTGTPAQIHSPALVSLPLSPHRHILSPDDVDTTLRTFWVSGQEDSRS